MSKILRRVIDSDGRPWGWRFYCPGCRDTHLVPVEGRGEWGFNGDEAKPTFTPSVLNHEVRVSADADPAKVLAPFKPGDVYSPRCHLFVTDGKIVYCGDCGHDHAGKTIDMVDIPDAAAAGETKGGGG